MTTETETPPAAEVVPAADGEKKAAVKGEKREFVQRVPKPERVALDAKIQSLQEQADKNQVSDRRLMRFLEPLSWNNSLRTPG